MKRFILLLIMAACLIALVSCGSEKDKEGETSELPSQSPTESTAPTTNAEESGVPTTGAQTEQTKPQETETKSPDSQQTEPGTDEKPTPPETPEQTRDYSEFDSVNRPSEEYSKNY